MDLGQDPDSMYHLASVQPTLKGDHDVGLGLALCMSCVHQLELSVTEEM